MSNPNITVYNERFSLVSSLYGPGTVGCWLFTLASVFVTWTLNVDSRRRDSITNDFIAALSFPAIAAGHFFYLLFFADHSTGSLVFTNTEPEKISYAAAAEAPINVCETFAAAALALFAIAAFRGHSRRYVCLLVVGLLAFSTEVVVFVKVPRIAVAESNLARPFLFNFAPAMASIIAFLVGSLFLMFVLQYMPIWIRYWHRDRSVEEAATQQQPTASPSPTDQGPGSATTTGGGQQPARDLETLSDEQVLSQKPDEEARRAQALRMREPAIITMLFLPLAAAMTSGIGTGLLGATKYMIERQNWRSRLSFFIPKSSVAITEMDQAVSLAAGAITLVFSLWDAYKSRLRAEKERAEMDLRIEAENNRRERIFAILKRRIDELDKIQNQLDRSGEGEEKTGLLETRARLRRELQVLVDLRGEVFGLDST